MFEEFPKMGRLTRECVVTEKIDGTNAQVHILATHEGSVAAPGYMKPEGIVIFHTAAGTMFKKTIEKDEQPKSLATERS